MDPTLEQEASPGAARAACFRPVASLRHVAAPVLPGTKVASVSDLRANGFLTFANPANGDPAVAVSLSGGNMTAYDAVCTDAGCTVEYDSGQRVLACPCHGAVFDPTSNAAELHGPAPRALDAIRVQVASAGTCTQARKAPPERFSGRASPYHRTP